ncbi:MAG TPA: hypothetical protein VLT59_10480, partial [Steroidobacteraceae bacterium]|nr:hypothetical protein [Steroidobacteraceae bacterium]
MAELSLRERLQPSLLDRLVDDQRFATIYRITADSERLKALGMTSADITGLLRLQGLKPLQEEHVSSASGAIELNFIG